MKKQFESKNEFDRWIDANFQQTVEEMLCHQITEDEIIDKLLEQGYTDLDDLTADGSEYQIGGHTNARYSVEFAFAENFSSVSEWDTMDEWMKMNAASAEQAAMNAANTDGFESALFRVYKLIKNEFGEWEKAYPQNPEYFAFGGHND